MRRLIAILTLVALLGGCSSGGHSRAQPKPKGRSSAGNASFPPGTRPPSMAAAANLTSAFFATEPGEHWYAGGGFSSSSLTRIELDVFVFASTRSTAAAHCAAVAAAAAFFMQGYDYAVKISGSVRATSGIVNPAKFNAFECAKPPGPLVDPVKPTVPSSLAASAEHFGAFLDAYIGNFGAGGSDAWDFNTDVTAGQITVGVKDSTPALGTKRCAMLRPLEMWFLGRFAAQATLRVAGSGNARWPARSCP